jgi:hypothetical protein
MKPMTDTVASVLADMRAMAAPWPGDGRALIGAISTVVGAHVLVVFRDVARVIPFADEAAATRAHRTFREAHASIPITRDASAHDAAVRALIATHFPEEPNR